MEGEGAATVGVAAGTTPSLPRQIVVCSEGEAEATAALLQPLYWTEGEKMICQDGNFALIKAKNEIANGGQPLWTSFKINAGRLRPH